MRPRGLEPPPSCPDQNLNLARLPIPPRAHMVDVNRIFQIYFRKFGRHLVDIDVFERFFEDFKSSGKARKPLILLGFSDLVILLHKRLILLCSDLLSSPILKKFSAKRHFERTVAQFPAEPLCYTRIGYRSGMVTPSVLPSNLVSHNMCQHSINVDH